MSFSFNTTAGASQSTATPKLEGNNIYAVKFDGVEIKDFDGVKDPSQKYKTLLFKFSNSDGIYEHTIFEPKKDDFQRKESEFTNKNGNTEKIPQASGVETMMLFFKHVIDAVNPKLATEIDNGTKQITAPSWDALRNIVIKATDPGKGTEVKIKLVKKQNGDATFPGFFSGVNREGKAYIRNNFIGTKVAFTAYELDKIKAFPTNMDTFNQTSVNTNKPSEDLSQFDTSSTDGGLDLNFDL